MVQAISLGPCRRPIEFLTSSHPCRRLLQGPRLMAWTTKSPIRGNHWGPLGCRALLGSVKAKIIKLQNFTATVVMFSEQAKNRWSCFSLGDRCRLVSSHHIFAAIIWLLKQFSGSYNGICHISRLFCQITVQFREGHKT